MGAERGVSPRRAAQHGCLSLSGWGGWPRSHVRLGLPYGAVTWWVGSEAKLGEKSIPLLGWGTACGVRTCTGREDVLQENGMLAELGDCRDTGH